MNNNQEIEAKVYIRNLDKIQKRLLEMEALLIQDRTFETNIRFDLPDNRLLSEGRVLRLRQDSHARLTYKASGENEQGVVSRTEIEFTVDDFEKARELIEALGYRKLLYYEKYRTIYDFNKCQVMLDELPYGKFIEIEGNSPESIMETADKLNIRRDAGISTGYHNLFHRLCKLHPDLDPTDLSFNALKDLAVFPEDLSVRAGDD